MRYGYIIGDPERYTEEKDFWILVDYETARGITMSDSRGVRNTSNRGGHHAVQDSEFSMKKPWSHRGAKSGNDFTNYIQRVVNMSVKTHHIDSAIQHITRGIEDDFEDSDTSLVFAYRGFV